RAGKLIIENREIDAFRLYVFTNFFQLSLTDKTAAIGLGQLLYKRFFGYSSCRFCEESQLRKIFFHHRLCLLSVHQTNQHGALFLLNNIFVLDQVFLFVIKKTTQKSVERFCKNIELSSRER